LCSVLNLKLFISRSEIKRDGESIRHPLLLGNGKSKDCIITGNNCQERTEKQMEIEI